VAWDRLGCSGIVWDVLGLRSRIEFPHAQNGGCLEGPFAPEGPGEVPAPSQGGLGTFPVARRASQYGKDVVAVRHDKTRPTLLVHILLVLYGNRTSGRELVIFEPIYVGSQRP
jgi:hypothetical protein